MQFGCGLSEIATSVFEAHRLATGGRSPQSPLTSSIPSDIIAVGVVYRKIAPPYSIKADLNRDPAAPEAARADHSPSAPHV